MHAVQNLSNYPATLKCFRRAHSGCKGNNELRITVTSKSHKHNNKTKQKKNREKCTDCPANPEFIPLTAAVLSLQRTECNKKLEAHSAWKKFKPP